MQSKFYLLQRKYNGQSLLELLAGAMVLIPIVLFGIDVAMVFMGQSMNTTICRDAARAAASGPPSSISPTLTPKQRAEAVVRRTQKAEGAIRIDPVVIVNEQVTRTPTLPFGGIVEGTVTVQTSVDVYPPFLLGHVVEKGAVKITASQTFPFTWVMASTYNISAVPGSAGTAPKPSNGSPVVPGLEPPPKPSTGDPAPVSGTDSGVPGLLDGGGIARGAPPPP